jgi:hypothetical protein
VRDGMFGLLGKMMKLQKGNSIMLSKADIAKVVINLPDAKRNLTKEAFEKVFALYAQYQKDKTKESYNLINFSKAKADMITEFNKIAPWKIYNGER